MSAEAGVNRASDELLCLYLWDVFTIFVDVSFRVLQARDVYRLAFNLLVREVIRLEVQKDVPTLMHGLEPVDYLRHRLAYQLRCKHRFIAGLDELMQRHLVALMNQQLPLWDLKLQHQFRVTDLTPKFLKQPLDLPVLDLILIREILDLHQLIRELVPPAERELAAVGDLALDGVELVVSRERLLD